MNHTPTPWKIEQGNEHCKLFSANGPTGWQFIGEIHTGHACNTDYRKNAEFIVTACNAHEELVDVLKLCKRNVEAQLYMLPYDASEQKDILSSWIGRINGALSLATIEKGV